MDDIVDRLDSAWDVVPEEDALRDLLLDAAAEIERLREQLYREPLVPYFWLGAEAEA